MSEPHFYPIGKRGQAWGAAELAQWRSLQKRQRSYAQEVLKPLEALRSRYELFGYGEVAYAGERFALMAARSLDWDAALPSVLITGGVHGYETSGVQGALRFLQTEAQRYDGRVNLLVAPCVSPWGYERIQRWNFDAIDPNRSFRANSPAEESAALMRLVAEFEASRKAQFAMHLDLHETTDTDESEFRPARAARDGLAFEPISIPDGFYLVADAARPQLPFQQAIIEAVQRVTHIAPADAQGRLIGTPTVAHGVVQYEIQALGLCPSVTSARYTTTTEVYPDSPQVTPEQCIEAQVAAIYAGLDFLIENGG